MTKTTGIAGDLVARRRPPAQRPAAPAGSRATARPRPLPPQPPSAPPVPPPPAPLPVTAPVRPGRPPRPKSKRRPAWRWAVEAVQYPLISAVALGAAYSDAIGQWFVAAYALLAIILRLGSKKSFGGGVLMLLVVPFFMALHQTGIAQNAGIYGFELLVFGTAQAIWEQHKIDKSSK